MKKKVSFKANKFISLSFMSLVIIFSVAILSTSCQKENVINPTTQADTNASTPDVSSKNGILILKNKAILQNTLNELCEMDENEIAIWEEGYNFKSQENIFNQINKAEIILEEKIYGGYDENLSLDELEELGVQKQYSPIYKKYISKGVIKEIKEEDGSEYFKLSVINPALANVLNADGLVVINDTVFQYTEKFVKILVNGDFNKIEELKSSTVSNETQGIVVFDMSLRGSHSWSKPSYWKTDGSTKRYCMNIVGSSSHSSSIMNSTFYVMADSQQKKWGSWKRRNTYNPIYSISGNWNYRYTKTYNNGPFVTEYSLPDSDNASPFYYCLNGSNYCKFNLVPNGSWSISSPWYWYDAVDVYYYRFTGSFYGGSSGYKIYANKG